MNDLEKAMAAAVADNLQRTMKGRKYAAQITKIDTTNMRVETLVTDFTDATISFEIGHESPAPSPDTIVITMDGPGEPKRGRAVKPRPDTH